MNGDWGKDKNTVHGEKDESLRLLQEPCVYVRKQNAGSTDIRSRNSKCALRVVDGQAYSQTRIQTDRQTSIQTSILTGGQTSIQTGRRKKHTDWQTNKHTD